MGTVRAGGVGTIRAWETGTIKASVSTFRAWAVHSQGISCAQSGHKQGMQGMQSG